MYDFALTEGRRHGILKKITTKYNFQTFIKDFGKLRN